MDRRCYRKLISIKKGTLFAIRLCWCRPGAGVCADRDSVPVNALIAVMAGSIAVFLATRPGRVAMQRWGMAAVVRSGRAHGHRGAPGGLGMQYWFWFSYDAAGLQGRQGKS